MNQLAHVNPPPYSMEDDLSETIVTKVNKMVSNPDKKRRKTCVKRPWSEEEKIAILRHFQKHILLKKVPNKKECDSCLAVENILSGRSWSHIKFCLKNMFKK